MSWPLEPLVMFYKDLNESRCAGKKSVVSQETTVYLQGAEERVAYIIV